MKKKHHSLLLQTPKYKINLGGFKKHKFDWCSAKCFHLTFVEIKYNLLGSILMQYLQSTARHACTIYWPAEEKINNELVEPMIG